jgi:IclR family transcriptional regulator, acetate operon repressor
MVLAISTSGNHAPCGTRRTSAPLDRVCDHHGVSTQPETPPRRTGAQSASRALAVLRCFEDVPGDLGVTELASRTGLTISTAHRLTRALVEAGLLLHDARTERYRLGPVLVVLGRRAAEQLGYEQAMPTMDALAVATGESVNLGIRSGRDVLVVLDVPSPQPLRFQQSLGTRVPLHTSAMGKCLLAFGPAKLDTEVKRLSLDPVTERTITSSDDLLAELEQTRDRGWGLNDEERNPGVRAVAAPVLGPHRIAVAALAVQGPTLRLTDERVAEIAPQIEDAATRIAPLLPAI